MTVHRVPTEQDCLVLCSMTLKHTELVFVMTSWNGNIFRVTGPLCAEFADHRWIPLTKASDAELWCFLWSGLNEWLSKQLRRWWFETPSRSLWRHCNVTKWTTQSTLKYIKFYFRMEYTSFNVWPHILCGISVGTDIARNTCIYTCINQIYIQRPFQYGHRRSLPPFTVTHLI